MCPNNIRNFWLLVRPVYQFKFLYFFRLCSKTLTYCAANGKVPFDSIWGLNSLNFIRGPVKLIRLQLFWRLSIEQKYNGAFLLECQKRPKLNSHNGGKKFGAKLKKKLHELEFYLIFCTKCFFCFTQFSNEFDLCSNKNSHIIALAHCKLLMSKFSCSRTNFQQRRPIYNCNF